MNVIVDSVRHRTARPETELSEEMSDKLTDGTRPDETVICQMDVQAALTEVSDEHREFLTLKFIQGLTNDEISEITGQNVNALRAMQFRALKSMRKILDREGAAR
jgi:RNA polymerase sigma-70 factor (ECF subfamily)